MPIYSGSRYESARVDFIKTDIDKGKNPVLFYSFPDIGVISYVEYEWREGDRLDSVAERFYDNGTLWWTILNYNPEIRDPQNIEAGTKLRIRVG
jgi:nucleoid-associated protein YgaU